MSRDEVDTGTKSLLKQTHSRIANPLKRPPTQDGAHGMRHLLNPRQMKQSNHLQLARQMVRHPDASSGRSVTRARRLYVSRLANFHLSDPRHKTVRMECAVSLTLDK